MKNITHKEFISRLKLSHPNLKVLEFYKASNKKILIEDNLGIQYSIYPSSLQQGVMDLIKSAVNKTEAFRIRLKFIQPDIVILGNYTRNNNKILVMDKLGIEYLVGSGSLLRGFVPSIKSAIDKTSAFKLMAKQVHGDKYDYSKGKYLNNLTKVEIICNKCQETFFQSPSNHLSGTGCPSCSSSRGEEQISLILKKLQIQFIREKTFPNCRRQKVLPFDFYLPQYNICIEFDGKQHYKPDNYFGGYEGLRLIQESDKIKTKYCKNNNINLLRIPYNKIKNIENIIDKFLKSLFFI